MPHAQVEVRRGYSEAEEVALIEAVLTLVGSTASPAGRCRPQRRLYTEIVERLEPLGIPRDHVSITLRERLAENWGIRGGQAACDLDLGFDVRV